MTGRDHVESGGPDDHRPNDQPLDDPSPDDRVPDDRPVSDGPENDDRVRERYLELDVESTPVGLIVDPTNQDAWILSDRPGRVEP